MNTDCTTFALGNGLRVIHQEDKTTSMVALAVLYHTGAKNEDPEHTGLAHLFEHLMFAGSLNAPDFDSALQKAGGINNAWTSNDFTCFYDMVPAQNAETLFWLESDRMHLLDISSEKFNVQRNVVVEEFYQQHINKPYGQLMHKMRELAYTTHPYRWPVIGMEPSHIQNANLDLVRQFYTDHYSPDNATLAIVGNLSFDKAEELTHKWFDDIPSRNILPSIIPVEPEVTAPRQAVFTDNVPRTLVSIGFPMDGYGSSGYYAADLISDILASGQSSIFYKNLILGTTLFDSIDASVWGSEHPGLFHIMAFLKDGVDENVAIEQIQKTIIAAVHSGFSEYDRIRAINRMESFRIIDNMGTMPRVQNLAMSFKHAEKPGLEMENYKSLSLDTLYTEAVKLFDLQRQISVIYRPYKS